MPICWRRCGISNPSRRRYVSPTPDPPPDPPSDPPDPLMVEHLPCVFLQLWAACGCYAFDDPDTRIYSEIDLPEVVFFLLLLLLLLLLPIVVMGMMLMGKIMEMKEIIVSDN
eukprot:751404-Hanusia_phi.AAC.7